MAGVVRDGEASLVLPERSSGIQHGHLELAASSLGTRTIIHRLHHTAPFHIGPPSRRDASDTASIVMQHVGPGLLPGDTLQANIVVEQNARLILRGQSGTRLYPCSTDMKISSTTTIRMDTGASFAWLPGDLIPFRDARYHQHTLVDLAADSQFLAMEIITRGREAMGERDLFSRLDLRFRVNQGARPLLIERNVLQPGARALGSPGRRGTHSRIGFFCSVGFTWRPEGASPADATTRWAAGSTGKLTIARLLGNDASDMAAIIHHWWERSWNAPR